jgi:hypothetical protein
MKKNKPAKKKLTAVQKARVLAVLAAVEEKFPGDRDKQVECLMRIAERAPL